MDQRVLSALRRAFERYCRIPDDAWAVAGPSFVERRLGTDDHLARAGERPEHIAFVVSGVLREYATLGDGVVRNRSFVVPGQLSGTLGELGIDAASTVSVQALAPTELLVAPVRALHRWSAEHAVWAQVVRAAAHVSHQQKQAQERALVTQTAMERYSALRKNRPGLLELVPHEHIASYIGVSPEALLRIRQGLKGRGQ